MSRGNGGGLDILFFLIFIAYRILYFLLWTMLFSWMFRGISNSKKRKENSDYDQEYNYDEHYNKYSDDDSYSESDSYSQNYNKYQDNNSSYQSKYDNAYKILGVSSSCTTDELKKAYRKKAMMYHPDRNSSDEATEKMAEINSAYDLILEKRGVKH